MVSSQNIKSNYHGYVANIERLTLANNNFRRVLYTAKHSQLVLMSLLPGEDIGVEVHTVDQFFRVEQGTGRCIINTQVYPIQNGSAIVVPAGARHNIINTSKTAKLKMYTVYSPANHRDGIVHKTKADAMRDKEHYDRTTTE